MGTIMSIIAIVFFIIMLIIAIPDKRFGYIVYSILGIIINIIILIIGHGVTK